MKDIHDIKSPIELFYNYLPFILISTSLLTLLIIFTYLTLRKRKPVKTLNEQVKVNKRLNSKELAISELEKIKKERLIELDRYQAFYNRLTTIVKNYLISEYNINLESKTTTEIINDINNLDINNQSKLNFEKCLKTYDYAKYSGYKLENQTMYDDFDQTNILFKTI